MNPSTRASHVLSDGHVSRHAIARAVAADLSAEEKMVFENHVHGCSSCHGHWLGAQSEAKEFMNSHATWEQLQKSIRERDHKKASHSRAWWEAWDLNLPVRIWQRWVEAMKGPRAAWVMATLVIGIGVSLFTLNSYSGKARHGENGESEWAAKGLAVQGEPIDLQAAEQAKTAYYVFVNGKSAMGDSLRVRAGDTIQLGIVSQNPVYYALYYRDDGNELKPYFAAGESSQTPIGNPQGENLPKSLVLDSLWKKETLYAMASPQRFSHAEALSRIKAQETGRLPKDSVTLVQFLLLSGQP
jgi:hypothetical protein